MSSSPALLKAVSAGRPRQVRLLLDSGVSVNDADDLGQTPLIRAIFIEHCKNREKIVKLLLQRGAMVSMSDVVGRTVLLWACLYGRSSEVGLVLENSELDLDLNRTDINGQTALFHAVTSGNAAVVKMMVDSMTRYGLTVDLPDYSGISPLMQAMRLGHDICGSILVHCGKATVGLGARYPRDFIQAEMWARKNKQKSESNSCSITEFPPILSQASRNKLRYRENRAFRSRLMLSNRTSPHSSDEEEFQVLDKKSDQSLLDSQITKCLGMKPNKRIPASLLAIQQSSSSESLDGSDEDDVDLFSFPELRRQATFCSTRELHKLYSIYQDQNTSSFKKMAYKAKETFLRESATSSESMIDANSGKVSHFNSFASFKEKWTSKKNLTCSGEYVDSSEEKTVCDSPKINQSKPSLGTLPDITDGKKSSLQSLIKGFKWKKSEKERKSDYSLV